MAKERKRSGGRAARRALREHVPIVQRRPVRREIPLYELLDADGIELIHDNAMTILEEVGIEFCDDEALALWRAGGGPGTP